MKEKRSAKERGNTNSMARGKRVRRRLGPDVYPTDRRERARMALALHREAEASGDLVVDMPTRIVLGDPAIDPAMAGQEIARVPERWVHRNVGQLDLLARLFIVHAHQHANAESAAVGHILTAVHAAIMDGNLDALNAPGGPHTWARRYLRDSSRNLPLPVETSSGKVLDMDQVSGGFRVLAEAIEWGLNATRAAGIDLDEPGVVENAANIMIHHFPSLSSLTFPDEPDWLKQIATVTGRIATPLREFGRRRRTEPAATAAADIAQELLETEFRLSGKSAEDVRRAFAFRNH